MPTKTFLREHWDRVAGWSALGLGAISMLLGWLGVSDTVFPAEQLPYILSGGVFGLFLCGVGATLLLSADLRDEWHKLDSIEDAIRESGASLLAGSPNGTTPDTARQSAHHVDSAFDTVGTRPQRRSRRQSIRATEQA